MIARHSCNTFPIIESFNILPIAEVKQCLGHEGLILSKSLLPHGYDCGKSWFTFRAWKGFLTYIVCTRIGLPVYVPTQYILAYIVLDNTAQYLHAYNYKDTNPSALIPPQTVKLLWHLLFSYLPHFATILHYSPLLLTMIKHFSPPYQHKTTIQRPRYNHRVTTIHI